MASSSGSTHVTLDDSDLEFSRTHQFTAQPDSALDNDNEIEDDTAGLLGGSKANKSGSAAFWSLAFYQGLFDVDTDDVKTRVRSALVPLPVGRSFLKDVTQGKPDLYGPVWICATLVISVAVTGNLANYFQTAWKGDESGFMWHYDFHQVSLAATAVFSYAWLVPAGIYAFLWWTASAALTSLTFLDLLCLYGYSLAIYVPVSVLWLIQSSALQWILVLVAAGLSGAVVLLTLWPLFKDGAVKAAPVLIGVIIALHLLLAAGFMLYFFHVPAVTDGSDAGGSAVKPEAIKGDEKAEADSKEAQKKEAAAAEKEAKKVERDTSEEEEEEEENDHDESVENEKPKETKAKSVQDIKEDQQKDDEEESKEVKDKIAPKVEESPVDNTVGLEGDEEEDEAKE